MGLYNYDVKDFKGLINIPFILGKSTMYNSLIPGKGRFLKTQNK